MHEVFERRFARSAHLSASFSLPRHCIATIEQRAEFPVHNKEERERVSNRYQFLSKITFSFSFHSNGFYLRTFHSHRGLNNRSRYSVKQAKFRIPLTMRLRRFSARIIFIMEGLPPIRHVAATSAVKLLRNVVVTPWAYASISLFAFEFRIRH